MKIGVRARSASHAALSLLGSGAAVRGACVAAVGMATTAIAVGCLSRPVTNQDPTTKTNFVTEVTQQSIDKVDLLFAIDNSSSMGDKQELLRLAVPDLVNRLLNPFCVDENDPTKVTGASTNGECPAGSQKEFEPVTDIHIGLVSSALGSGGGDYCKATDADPVNPNLLANGNDRGRLLNRPSTAEGQGLLPEFQPSGFLSWLPNVDKNREKLAARPQGLPPALGDVTALVASFQEQVARVREYGCGYEAQLESVYRFLVQPDPYAEIVREGNNPAELRGIDTVLLRQRAEFLRPDSLLAVIMITDENESNIDPLALGGRAWYFTNQNWPGSPQGTAPRSTTTCEANPQDPGCTSCGVTNRPNDPNCAPDRLYYTRAEDEQNVRFFHMKRRFGVDPQFPIDRYVKGFKDARVPNQDGEHRRDAQSGAWSSYIGEANCANPLYSKDLPREFPEGITPEQLRSQVCDLPRGPRTQDLVFFAVIGGVPWQLLVKDPSATTPELKDKLTAEDWTKILGKNPINYEFDGADPHMIESVKPRAGITAGESAPDTSDPLHGREWDTQNKDLQFACTFPLPASKDCDLPQFKNACDCDGTKDPPLCATRRGKIQTRGKAYPTIKPLYVAKQMDNQGIAASICPIRVVDNTPDKTDPLFGYRPAVKTIIDRLRNALARQCLPQKLNPDPSGNAPCLILETLGEDGPQSDCDDIPGRSQPDARVLAQFKRGRDQRLGEAGARELANRPVCQLRQLVVEPGETCVRSSEAGWCYVVNANGKNPAGTCPQAILFSPGTDKPGSRISLQCIKSNETNKASTDVGGGTAAASLL